jgi:DNA-3-methyladenine glycosylase
MFGPAGGAYVYRIYGLHWCFNIVCDAQAPGSAVLIRAVEPVHGIDVMMKRRGTTRLQDLCAGPGRLCQALNITGSLNGIPVTQPPFTLRLAQGVAVVLGPRIGIRRGVSTPWRFGLEGSRFLSRPMT